MDNEETGGSDVAAVTVPTRERVINFYGDPIYAAQTSDETIYIPLRPICEHLGLTWPGQWERVKKDPVLAEAVRSVRVTLTERGARTVLCLPLDLLPGWLFGIQAGRVKPELQEKITRYRRECFRVLWQAFRNEIMPAAAAAPGLTTAQRALEVAEAVVALARQQVAHEAQLAQLAAEQQDLRSRHQVMADYLRGYIQQTQSHLDQHDQRLVGLEIHLSAGARISEAQAAEVALAVKTVAHALESRGQPNGYQRVYSELYRRYNIGAYRNLPTARYEEALAWLRKWYEELAGPDLDRIKES